MELLQLTYFCEAARKENFSRTAKKFSVPASDISQSVSRLERELGRKLFDRHPNRIVLNDYGKAFLEQIQPALAGIDAAVRKMSDSDMDMKTELRLQICVCRSIVTEAIERFRPAYPDVTFYISHSSAPDDDADIIIAEMRNALRSHTDAALAADNHHRHLRIGNVKPDLFKAPLTGKR